MSSSLLYTHTHDSDSGDTWRKFTRVPENAALPKETLKSKQVFQTNTCRLLAIALLTDIVRILLLMLF